MTLRPPPNCIVPHSGAKILAEPTSLTFQAPGIYPVRRIVSDIGINVDVSAAEADGILADKPLQAGMVVARPRVPPVASTGVLTWGILPGIVFSLSLLPGDQTPFEHQNGYEYDDRRGEQRQDEEP